MFNRQFGIECEASNGGNDEDQNWRIGGNYRGSDVAIGGTAFGQYYGPYNGPALINGETPVIVDFPSPYSSETSALGGGAGIYSGLVNASPAGFVCDDFTDDIGPPNDLAHDCI